LQTVASLNLGDSSVAKRRSLGFLPKGSLSHQRQVFFNPFFGCFSGCPLAPVFLCVFSPPRGRRTRLWDATRGRSAGMSFCESHLLYDYSCTIQYYSNLLYWLGIHGSKPFGNRALAVALGILNHVPPQKRLLYQHLCYFKNGVPSVPTDYHHFLKLHG
jgi:hypothetical protein